MCCGVSYPCSSIIVATPLSTLDFVFSWQLIMDSICVTFLSWGHALIVFASDSPEYFTLESYFLLSPGEMTHGFLSSSSIVVNNLDIVSFIMFVCIRRQCVCLCWCSFSLFYCIFSLLIYSASTVFHKNLSGFLPYQSMEQAALPIPPSSFNAPFTRPQVTTDQTL